jgi:plastocyanin
VLALAAVATAPPPAIAQNQTTIQGRVDIQRTPSAVERRLSAIDGGDSIMRETPREPRAVVYFESAPRGAFEDRDSRRASLDQRNETFVPHLLAITVGTVVDFPNSDRTYHNVFSLSKAKRFDLGRYAAGHSKSIVFDRPGIVRVFCDIHSHMNAFILVFSHRFFAVTDTEGRYAIGGVPAGTYTLSAWYEGSVRDAHTVTITGESRAAELNFTIR